MMRRALSIGIFLCLAFPASAQAATPDLYRHIAASASSLLTVRVPREPLLSFVLEEMRTWEGVGIRLTADDLAMAYDDNDERLCTNKTDANGTPLTLSRGTEAERGPTCAGLKIAIRSLIDSEQRIDALGADLIALTNAADLGVADEPGRPLDITATAGALKRAWSGGTGSTTMELPASATPFVQAVTQALTQEADPDVAVRRFRHGVLRDQREADPALLQQGTAVGSALLAFAQHLRSTQAPGVEGVYSVPSLTIPDVTLWARTDDVGLLWTYPTRVSIAGYRRAGAYPTHVQGGETLAYPFSYTGTQPQASPLSPLCSRPLARYGYLCRSMPASAPACTPPPGTATEISLVRCSLTTTTTAGPSLCDGFADLLRRDDGRQLSQPVDATVLASFPSLPIDEACTPDAGAIYPDDISTHACYISACLAQSMSGHSLVPGRAPTLMNESTAPFLACMRPDPALGLLAEVARPVPTTVPRYEGHEIVASLERSLCIAAGKGHEPIPGLCADDRDANAANPLRIQSSYAALADTENILAIDRTRRLLGIFPLVGLRAAQDQSAIVMQRALAGVQSIVEQTASLLQSLERAPLPRAACPLTGPLPLAP